MMALVSNSAETGFRRRATQPAFGSSLSPLETFSSQELAERGNDLSSVLPQPASGLPERLPAFAESVATRCTEILEDIVVEGQ